MKKAIKNPAMKNPKIKKQAAKQRGENFVIVDKKIALVASRFNESLVDALVEGAQKTLIDHGAKNDDIALFRVPGAFEIPLLAQKILQQKKYAAVVALGVVIRGETPHFDYVAAACANGIARLNLDFGTPVAFGILTTDTAEQAFERAGGKSGNKGTEAASAAIEMLYRIENL